MLYSMFNTSVYVEELDYDYNSLRQICLDELQVKGHDNGAHLPITPHDKLSSLVQIVVSRINNVAKNVYKIRDEYELAPLSAWINKDTTESNAGAHAHPDSTLSAVLYISADENSSQLKFLNPNIAQGCMFPSNIIKELNEYNTTQYSVAAQTGKLLVFPSVLHHYISTQSSDVNNNRISLAVDTVVVRK